MSIRDRQKPTSGQIHRAYVAVCSVRGCRSIVLGGDMAAAAKEFRASGWTKRRALGWICQRCAVPLTEGEAAS